MKKNALYYIITLSALLVFGCEAEKELGFDESDPGLNFRMIADASSFNLFEGNPEVTFTMYSENKNIDHVNVVVELYQFATDKSTPRSVLTEIGGSSITNDGSSKLTFSLSDFAAATGVDMGDIQGGDVFTIYNVVELENGMVFPDTVHIDLDGDGDLDPFLNIDPSFLGGTSAFVAQLSFPIVCPVSSPFVGTYAITDDCANWTGNVEITNNGGAQREFSGNWGGFDGIGFTFDLVCGKVFVSEQSIGLGCGATGNVDVVTSTTLGPALYDDGDDSQFSIQVYYSNPDCFGGFDCTLNFVKQ